MWRGEATDVSHILLLTEQGEYDELIKYPEMRYGHSRLVRLAYPKAPKDLMELLAVAAFLDGPRD